MYKLKIKVIQPHPDHPEDDSKEMTQTFELSLPDSRFLFFNAELHGETEQGSILLNMCDMEWQ